MYSQSAFRYGPYIAHFSLLPTNPSQTHLGTYIPLLPGASPTALQEQLHTYFSSNPATYTIRAQFASSKSAHNVEDAGGTWYESTAPWFELGTIELPAQESYSEARRVWWEDKIALSPWNGLVEHQPLGSINRLRKRVYATSRAKRAEANGVSVHFPRSASEMPD